MAEAELLGGGLDIEGWSFIKNEVQGKINEMTDRQGFILANQFFFKKEKCYLLPMFTYRVSHIEMCDCKWF